MMSEYEDLYLAYLNECVPFIYADRRESYEQLCRQLLNTDFYYTHPLDENRVTEACKLRENFLAHEDGMMPGDDRLTRKQAIFLNEPISVLEIMIGMALSCEERIMYTPIENRSAFWFYTMLQNARLYNFVDAGFSNSDVATIDHIIRTIMNHEYDPDGSGSFWPSKNPHLNLRNMDLWAQMNNFLVENNYQ